ncbi:hypothetical protein KAJ27_02425, partial [bacterium]|nr:hypothetical protein [bacterium]
MSIFLLFFFTLTFIFPDTIKNLSVDSVNPFDPAKGIRVKKNQTITVNASGSWTLANGDYPFTGPQGYNPPFMFQNKQIYFYLQGRINGNTFIIGKTKSFIVSDDGILLFGHDDLPFAYFNNAGTINLTVTIKPAELNVMIPGIPVSITGNEIINPIKGKTYSNGITGLPIIQEDKNYTWYGYGEKKVTLAPDSKITYSYDFGDSYDTKLYTRTFNPFNVTNVPRNMYGIHKYKESGKIYSIYLTIKYKERIQQGLDKFIDKNSVNISGPFNVIVVDHTPQFLGFAMPWIQGCGNITEKNIPLKKWSDIIYEDQNIKPAEFTGVALLQFYHELPSGMDTGVNPDRFSGVDPKSVQYKIDFGDLTPQTNWFPFTSVNNLPIPDKTSPITQSVFFTKIFTHFYKIPGTYKMKLQLKYKEVNYNPKKINSTTYSYTKTESSWKYTTGIENIIVIDRTPASINKTEIHDYIGFTGDDLDFKF